MEWLLVGGTIGALAGYTGISAIAARELIRPYRRLPQIEPSAVGLTYEDVWLKARGEDLNIAAWHIPARDASRAVIIAHGIGGCRSRELTVSSMDLVQELVESGFTVLMLDLRGHGESDSAYMTYGLNERRDILGAVDWLLAHGYAAGSIGVLGFSMGGVAGIEAAAEEPAIAALVVDSACADFLNMMQTHFQRFSKLPLVFIYGSMLIGRFILGQDLSRLRPAETLRTIKACQSLIFHGGKDNLVPLAHAQELAQAGQAELVVTPDVGHLGSYAANPRTYSRRVIRFFKANLAMPAKLDKELYWIEVGGFASYVT